MTYRIQLKYVSTILWNKSNFKYTEDSLITKHVSGNKYEFCNRSFCYYHFDNILQFTSHSQIGKKIAPKASPNILDTMLP